MTPIYYIVVSRVVFWGGGCRPWGPEEGVPKTVKEHIFTFFEPQQHGAPGRALQRVVSPKTLNQGGLQSSASILNRAYQEPYEEPAAWLSPKS